MICHIVTWSFDKKLNNEQRAHYFTKVKHAMEGLVIIDNVESIEVRPLMKPCDQDIIMIARFDSLKALENYQVDSRHVEARAVFADILTNRLCYDFEE